MSRNGSILLNKANKVLKILDYKYSNITLGYQDVEILFPGVSRINYAWEPVFQYFIKENVNWSLQSENNVFILKIWLQKKIDAMAATAFRMKHKFTRKNTKVVVFNGEVKMYLFGNLIAKTENSSTWITDAGWPTKTTKNRLNGLGADIRLSKGKFILNEKFNWDGSWIRI